MSIEDPFKVPSEVPLLTPIPTAAKCVWLLPLPENAPPRTKRRKCGREAMFKIRVVDNASDVLADVCDQHKAEHDETAASLRLRGKGTFRSQMRRKAG